ncbi:protein croquemort-like [Oppia nitens]|uniref:protein croquemort-like n=1 Tax=Oppia nitens TaxID=1686743 RepID=UPI0023DB272C|nr:protein croquemort-like [Oppia nitens]
MKKSSIIWISIAFVLVLMGMISLIGLPIILVKIIDSKVILTPDGESYRLWRDLPVPIYLKFYLFNVTNAQQIQSSGAKPELKQIGPFVYRVNVRKDGVNFTDGYQSVTFNELMTYHFDRQLSVDDLSLKITTLNSPLAIAMTLMEDLNPMMKIMATVLIRHIDDDFFVEKSVEELLFDGYPDLLTKLAPLLNPKIPYQPSFGWMYKKNDTYDGLFKVNTGKSDIKKVNAIETFNGQQELDFWSGKECNTFKGAKNGELFNPIPSSDKTLLLFRTNFCRVLTLIWKSAQKSQYGDLSVYRYYPSDNTFANSSDYPPNSCYKPNKTRTEVKDFDNNELDLKTIINRLENLIVTNDSDIFTLLEDTYMDYKLNGSKYFKNFTDIDVHKKYREFPSGIFDLSACYFKAPVYISNAHFLNADPYYLQTVSGLKPDPSVHQSFLDIEPMTGTPIELQLRVQINVFISSVANYFIKYKNMPKIHIPVVWQEFTIHATDELAKDLHWKLTGPLLITTIVSSLLVAIGSLTLLYFFIKPVIKRCRNLRSTDSLMIDENPVVDNCDTSALIDDSQPTYS